MHPKICSIVFFEMALMIFAHSHLNNMRCIRYPSRSFEHTLKWFRLQLRVQKPTTVLTVARSYIHFVPLDDTTLHGRCLIAAYISSWHSDTNSFHLFSNIYLSGLCIPFHVLVFFTENTISYVKSQAVFHHDWRVELIIWQLENILFLFVKICIIHIYNVGNNVSFFIDDLKIITFFYVRMIICIYDNNAKIIMTNNHVNSLNLL